ncbi:MAG: peptidoglycan recognition family protein [Isosphaeraceae bacterium]|nr:peptidoglycan recognition family protein [Isosphaeraceae bacterium]
MAQLLPASFVPRTYRRAAWLIALLLAAVALAPGCSHKRSSMRPVYVTPAPAATITEPCPTPGPGVAVPAPSSEPSLSPSVRTSPSVEGTPSVSVPLIDKSTSPAGISPPPAPAPPPADEVPPSAAPGGEPSLNLKPVEPANGSGAKSSNSAKPPTLQGPTSLQDGQLAPAPAGRVRQASLPQTLAPLVNDPSGLFWPPKADKPWKYVVLHHSATPRGGLDAIDHEHRETHRWDGCGYHFVIGNGTDSPDGQIEVAPRWANQKQGIHCRNAKHSDMTEYGIGICLVGDLDKSAPTAKQVESTKKLVAYLSSRYQIPASRIATHEHLAANPTACPGKLFPMQAIVGQGNVVAR